MVEERNLQKDCVFDVATTGDPIFAKTALISQKIQRGATSTTVYDDRDTTKAGEKVTFTAIVALQTQGRRIPTGSVQFTLDGKRVSRPVKLDSKGHAKWTTARMMACEYHVAAQYIPGKESVFLPSSSFDTSRTVMSKQCGRDEKSQ